ncbi:primosomal protein N' (replication factor Y) [Parabacteroides sp. PF5-5]|uniref:replication restart helicase PriA n=1 Tax=unclassified Parabacteroides TaxID=2649774 RepID=UPI002476A832|nr:MULTISPECIES: primosomal protein N' [unclassified Parabacteroides]MDH6305380.1 primosomal protein N' (replication factor Y) [Parabacteroides sp. PH5-39]MDH6316090.1 primosomal protein N' (replication factor Y) [Parabacteroides sp. PF5-13]MDH6320240.1 primosomal protein N' (replication factor Y) [Parabacteroides sp. PH5-13]MDH6323970.1 primosomal protein N' (replication factor Y) [Parabacteroides sp. PH5-8]MDH6327281.1 primosomal protein N' (replication factor Y) [Parabacteroides sp. PH5-41]
MKYTDVILPLPLENTYTYRIPADLEKAISPGCRVLVPFGKKRYYTAIVVMVHERTPETDFEIKEIYALLDATPILRRPQLRFWQWISSYYICKLGDVYKAAVPSGLKLESETVVEVHESYEAETPLRKNEQALLDAFGGKDRLTISELEKKTGLKNVVPIVASLMARGAVEVSEEMKRGFTPKMQTYIRLSAAYHNEEKLAEAFTVLKRAAKQEALLLSYLDISHVLNPQLAKELSRKELQERTGCSAATLGGLLKRGILESYEKEVGRLQMQVCRLQPLSPLSDAQKKANLEIHDAFQTKDVCLLYGVTSSGKTEVYTHLIDEVLNQGRQVLYLLPEIAITTQITERLARLFGDKLLVYHSKFSDNERVEVWNKLLYGGEPMLVLGVRSSLFLPFKDLGLIIVDEEHENTYKQQDPAPRYHARNAAIILAGMHGAKTLLGSATPSIDSYYNALTGKFGLVELKTRYGDCLMPEIIPVDIKDLRRRKIMKDTLFSPQLVQKITAGLEKGEQSILFQNRRGFAPMIECKSCGWVPHCINCDVSLTYHKYHNRLECHYCGHAEQQPRQCPQCQSTELKMLGFGTEKVEEEVTSLFPSATVERMDFDSARTRTAYERIIADFEKGKTQILIGTQMLSKGLDFGNVGVVGILNADSLLNFPDFRAHERAYQLMVQVSGRAGRRDKQGMVILQTSQPEHPIIRMVQNFNYEEMVQLQLSERSIFKYPPYYRLIVLVIRSRNEDTLQQMSTLYADSLRARLGDRVLGPVTPPITRVQTFHVRKILLKIEVAAAIAPVREIIEGIHAEMQRYLPFKQLLVHYDVDPV